MKTKKIAFFDTKPYDRQFFDDINKKYGFDIKYFKGHLTVDTAPLTAGFKAICIFVNDTVNADVINILKKNGVQLIALRCAGYNNVDLRSAYNAIHVVRVPAYSPHAVAEHAVALILGLNRKTHKAYYRTRDLNFTINGLLGFDMCQKTLGVIGTGKIGRIFIQIMKGFKMNVLAFDPFPDKQFAQSVGFKYVDLNTLYRESDIISLHCPLTKETQYIINEKHLSQMKDGVMIVNTSRGKLIDTKTLIKFLKNGKIGAAGLDVYEEETEYFFEDFSASVIGDDVLARLMTFPNVLITSHQGFFTREAMCNIADTTLGNIKQYFAGKELTNEICYKCEKPACERKKSKVCF